MVNGEGLKMSKGGGQLKGMLGFIAIIVVINVLSMVFDWGYYFY